MAKRFAGRWLRFKKTVLSASYSNLQQLGWAARQPVCFGVRMGTPCWGWRALYREFCSCHCGGSQEYFGGSKASTLLHVEGLPLQLGPEGWLNCPGPTGHKRQLGITFFITACHLDVLCGRSRMGWHCMQHGPPLPLC